jgi:glycosyltransferase involved in cell wall biosynthesis
MSGEVAEGRHFVFVAGTSEPGGLHVHTAEIAQACADLGHRVAILCPSVNHFEGLISDARVVVECIPPLGDGRWHERIARWHRVARGNPRPDIVFCRGSFAETQIFNLTAAASLARRVFAIEHRPWTDPWRRRISKRQYGRLSGLLLHRSIAVSEEIKASAVGEFSFPARKMTTCLNWVHPQFCLPTDSERSEARAALSVAPSTLLVGYAGRLAPEKRIDVLLRAFAILARRSQRPIKLGIMGEGWKRQELTELAIELGIAHQVRFFGWSTTPWRMLRACDVFVLPSLVEGFPLALMEAMAVGCACLAHPMSSAGRLIENGKTGMLVDMTIADGLAAALHDLIERGPDDRRRMGSAAAAQLAADFSRERRMPDLLAALDIPATTPPQARTRLLAFNGS